MTTRQIIFLVILFALMSVTLAVAFVMLSNNDAVVDDTLVAVPTVAVLPSFTPSLTPSDTPTPTPTATLIPTDTPTLTITPSVTPSVTFTPSITFTPSLTPSDTPTATPTWTASPVASPTPELPQIISFTTNTTTVTPGAQIVLRWQTIADSARIEVLTEQGALVNTIPVQTQGETTLAVPQNLTRRVTFRLVASRGGQEANAPLAVTIQCPVSWFFGDDLAPADAGCPDEVGAVGNGAFQPFERGVMIRVTADDEDEIFVLIDSGNRYEVYENEWDGDDDDLDTDDDPPDDLELPEEEFNYVYYNEDAIDESFGTDLGWATDDRNDNDRTIQFNADRSRFFIDGPGNRLYYLVGGNDDGNGGTWQRIR